MSEPRQQDGAVPPKTTTTLGGFRLRADPRQLDALSLPTSSSRIDAQQRDKDALAALNAGTTEWTKKTQLHREAAMAPELRALSQALFERETRVVVPPKAKEGSDVGASSTSYEQSLPEMSVTKSRMLASTLDGLPSSNASAPTAKRPLSPVPVKPTSISRSPPTKKKPFTATTRTIPGPRKANQAHVPRPFHQLMHDVIFCISGLQNPERREIRDKATDMGARYRQQWTDDATHLVAVFANAPKHLEMKASGHGIAVVPSYIEECHRSRKRLPESDYLLEPAQQHDDDGEEEDESSDSDNSGQAHKRQRVIHEIDDEDVDQTSRAAQPLTNHPVSAPHETIDDLDTLPPLEAPLSTATIYLDADSLGAVECKRLRRIVIAMDGLLVASVDELRRSSRPHKVWIRIEEPDDEERQGALHIEMPTWIDCCREQNRLCDFEQ